ncbi:alpha/beta hydrolase [Streptomyces mobaraensis NBRC 13819 = DSM 40847]|uniref:Putative alpha or beta hydrolase n=1 Tax=Streptomyces mobaraensis (strain ATCC 29032 / DSM 40847 / JCM 4168 / NBRC 13819 / NCIMB 11159 / IPCR 16-22) TaxID=1223523 RepID=M3B8F2_STRM1|nr:alpha/beta hydrolase [Streptomyces mobaraensis]EMF02278.1 putative alpha or beta hydrolase [Streptomyces mobaraensis NBRC 13819 = DSM 40847]QTT73534.1 alpha/beta hydrolase [Streptomyces mobaraensis NBRC 13819 = DSM 40847]
MSEGRPPGRMLRIGGTALHVLSEGSGPACVLSPGLGMGWFDWDPVVPLLTPHRTVVRFDRPGLGFSAPQTEPPTAEGEAARIAGVLDALGLPGPATVVGHSLAGFHAEAFARLHPERTAGLVLVDTSVEENARPLPARALRTAVARARGHAFATAGLPRALGPALRRLAVRASSVERADPVPAELVRRTYGTGRVARALLMENARYFDVAAELEHLRAAHPLPPVPTHVLAASTGTDSRLERRRLTRQRALATLLDAHFTTIAPAGHLLMYDRPEAVAGAVLEAPRFHPSTVPTGGPAPW